MEREQLYNRINRRVDMMIDQGRIEEVKTYMITILEMFSPSKPLAIRNYMSILMVMFPRRSN